MPKFKRLPRHLRPRRQKVFTDGRQTPIDRNDRARLMFLAHVARCKGQITRAGVDILRALIFQFANLKDGRCFPSYERIAEAAGCDERTVGRCLPQLEAMGLVTWVNRLRRIKERVEGLAGVWAATWRVTRTSNAYDFPLIAKKTPEIPTKGQNSRGTNSIVTSSFCITDLDPQNPLHASLIRLGQSLGYLPKAQTV